MEGIRMSPHYKTNRAVLDRPKPLEMVLELASFAGGENTIGEDIALKNNEARIIENWDSLSMGGMIRSKGFALKAAVPNVDSYDVLLIHFDGADAATSAVETTSAKVITFAGTAQLDTAQKKFGLSSLLLDGNSDSVSVPDHADYNFGTGNFTFDLQLRINTDQDCVLIGQYEDANNYWYLKYDQVNSKLIFKHVDGGTTRADYDFTWNPSTGTWYHIEVARSTTSLYIFIDGTSQTLTANTAIASNDLGDIAGTLVIGQQNSADYVDGWIDEVRVCKGVARHTANFTAPTEAYVTDGIIDLLAHHKEGSNTRLYGLILGDLVYKNSAAFSLSDASGFTPGTLSHAVSAGDKLWITNAIDNLKYATIAGNLTTPSSQPGAARERIYLQKYRLFAEGGGETVYGSKAGSSNWTDADAWSAASDAWSLTLPNPTYGAAMGFPSGSEITVWDYFGAYAIYNIPDVGYRPLRGVPGCCAPYSIAVGEEGVYFLSNFPKLGVYLWTGVEVVELTQYHDFVDDIDLTKRIYGVYRNRKYKITYCESGSGVTYPNRTRIYDAQYGRWMRRPISTDYSDTLGYPALLKYDSNELYFASSQKGQAHEFETTDNSDAGENTQANYKTKDFSSQDFALASGGQFPIDNVRFKLTKMVVVFWGTVGAFSINYNLDKGAHSGSQTFDLTAEGDLINTTFTVNVSKIIAVGDLPDQTVIRSFKNSAVGRLVNFQILNIKTGARPKIKKIKIHAIALEEA